MKRVLYIISLVLLCLLLVMGLFVALLHSSKIQTSVASIITKHLEKKIDAHIEVGHLEYKFFNRLIIKHIYIEDQQKDTLLYVENVEANLDLTRWRENRICFRQVSIDTVFANFYHLPDSSFNFAFLGNYFNKTPSADTFPLVLRFDNVSLTQARVRFDDYKIHSLNAILSAKHIAQDSLAVALEHLNAVATHPEREPLLLQKARIEMNYNGKIMHLPQIYVEMPQSKANIYHVRVGLPKNRFQKIDFQRIKMQLNVANTQLFPCDFAFFAPKLKTMVQPIEIDALVVANRDSLEAKHLNISYKNKKILQADAMLYSMFEREKFHFRANCQELFANRSIIQDLVSDLTNKPFVLPARLKHFGDVRYVGHLQGHFPYFAMRGAFKNALGTITMDGQLETDSLLSKWDFKGKISTKRFKLAKLTRKQNLKYITVEGRGNGHFTKKKPANANIMLNIKELDYGGYVYQQIKIRGRIDHKKYSGSITIEDPNVNLAIDGHANLHEHKYDGTIEINKCNLSTIKLIKAQNNMQVSGKTRINLSGKTLEDLFGTVVTEKAFLQNDNDQVVIEKIEISNNKKGDEHVFCIISDYISGHITGDFRYDHLTFSFQKMLLKYVPSLFTHAQKKKINQKRTKNKMDIAFSGHNLSQVVKMFFPELSLQGAHKLDCTIDDQQDEYVLNFYSANIGVKNTHFNNIILNLNAAEKLDVALATDFLRHPNSPQDTLFKFDMNIDLQTQLYNDSAFVSFDFLDNNPKAHNAGKLEVQSHIAQYKNKPIFDILLLPNDLLINDSLLTISQGMVNYNVADKTVKIDSFRLGNRGQEISVDGVISKKSQDFLDISLRNIDILPILPLVGVSQDKVSLGGILTGNARIHNLMNKPTFNAQVEIQNTTVNNDLVGTTYATTRINSNQKRMDIAGFLLSPDRKKSIVNGHVDMDKKKWHLDILADSVSMGFVSHWTGSVMTMQGTVSGNVEVYGENKLVWVTAEAKGNNLALHFPFTGGTYYTSDSVFMTPDAIVFDDTKFEDGEHNELICTGLLKHQNFRNFEFNLHGNFDNLTVIDLPTTRRDIFSGKVYADGELHVVGDMQTLSLDAFATATENSDIQFNISSSRTTKDNNFIHFVDFDSINIQTKQQENDAATAVVTQTETKPSTRLLINLQVEVTPTTRAKIILSETNNDMITGNGSGEINYTYDTQTDVMRLYGSYNLLDGNFAFTLGNIIHKNFSIAEGSTITWNGPIATPTIDAKAIYRVTAGLRDLFGEDFSTLQTDRNYVPVNCVINIRDQLINPTIQFAIELPNSDETIQEQVNSIINTEEMLMQQVVYLLVFNRFFTPDYLRSTQLTGTSETYSLLSSTISGQINAWLNKLTDKVAVGFNFRTDGEGANASQEYETTFQLKPINRLIINGSFGYRYNDLSNRPFFGDVDLEYLLTADGRLRLKGYTHSVDKYSLKQANMVEGLGFSYNYDFNRGDTRKNIKNALKKRERKREERKQRRQEQRAN